MSRLLQQLLDASVLERELPFGESTRSTKRTRYRIHDPTLRFWFRVYSPHRTRWRRYGKEEKQKLLHDHASTVFEDFCREPYDDAARYWERDVELDMVRSQPRKDGQPALIVSEIKWTRLTTADRSRIEKWLSQAVARSALSRRYGHIAFEVLDASALKQTRREQS